MKRSLSSLDENQENSDTEDDLIFHPKHSNVHQSVCEPESKRRELQRLVPFSAELFGRSTTEHHTLTSSNHTPLVLPSDAYLYKPKNRTFFLLKQHSLFINQVLRHCLIDEDDESCNIQTPSYHIPIELNTESHTSPSSFLVIIFYPSNFLKYSTQLILTFNSYLPYFRNNLNSQIVAISTDSLYSTMAWCSTPLEKNGLGNFANFPMISDLDHSISKLFGVLVDSRYTPSIFITDHHHIVKSLNISDTNDNFNLLVQEVSRIISYSNPMP